MLPNGTYHPVAIDLGENDLPLVEIVLTVIVLAVMTTITSVILGSILFAAVLTLIYGSSYIINNRSQLIPSFSR